jgi:hypothetical protein
LRYDRPASPAPAQGGSPSERTPQGPGRPYDAGVRNTKAFKDAVAKTLSELAHRGVTVRPGAVADVVEGNMRAVAERLRIQERSAWRYFDAAAIADSIVHSHQEFEQGSADRGIGPAMPPIDYPELAVILASVPDDLESSGGDLYSVLLNVAVNAWTSDPTATR